MEQEDHEIGLIATYQQTIDGILRQTYQVNIPTTNGHTTEAIVEQEDKDSGLTTTNQHTIDVILEQEDL